MSRAWYRSLLEPSGAARFLHHLDVSDERCLRQIAQRKKVLRPANPA